jgi:hypothetical protein
LSSTTRTRRAAGPVPADAAAVQFHQALHQRQADPQAALRTADRLGRLGEHLEDVRQDVYGDAEYLREPYRIAVEVDRSIGQCHRHCLATLVE